MTAVKVSIPIILLMVDIDCLFSYYFLFNCLIVHGHTPKDLLAATIIYIPKDYYVFM